MNQITSMPQFLGAVAHCHSLHQKLEKALRDTARDMEELRNTAFALQGFFKDGLPVSTTAKTAPPASEAGVPVPHVLLADKTPSIAPRKHYEKVVAIVGASKTAPHFSDICNAWSSMGWDGFQDAKFKDIVRAAIKTAVRVKKLKHKGGHNGTYHLA